MESLNVSQITRNYFDIVEETADRLSKQVEILRKLVLLGRHYARRGETNELEEIISLIEGKLSTNQTKELLVL